MSRLSDRSSKEEILKKAITYSLSSPYGKRRGISSKEKASDFIKENNLSGFIQSCFEWSKTDEGHSWWNNIRKEISLSERQSRK